MDRRLRAGLVIGALLQVALFAGAGIALAASDVDAWSARLDGMFGIATVGQLAILAAALIAWPGQRPRAATIAGLVTAFGLCLRIVGSIVDLARDKDPVALIVSSFPFMFIGLFVVGVVMVRTTGRADRRSWVPVGVAVIGVVIGNVHQVSHKLDFTVSGPVWAALWITFAAVTLQRVRVWSGEGPRSAPSGRSSGRAVGTVPVTAGE